MPPSRWIESPWLQTDLSEAGYNKLPKPTRSTSALPPPFPFLLSPAAKRPPPPFPFLLSPFSFFLFPFLLSPFSRREAAPFSFLAPRSGPALQTGLSEAGYKRSSGRGSAAPIIPTSET